MVPDVTHNLQPDLEGFPPSAMDALGDDFEEEEPRGMSAEEEAAFMAEFGLAPDGTPLRRQEVVRDRGRPLVGEAAARTARALALGRRDLAGMANARRATAVAISSAARTAREICRAAQVAVVAGDKRNLPMPPGLPAADPGINLTARILPTPRT